MASSFEQYVDFCRIDWVVVDLKRQPVARVICERCQGTDFISLHTRLPADIVKRKLKDKGWRHEKRARWTCPLCVIGHLGGVKKPHMSPSELPEHNAFNIQPKGSVMGVHEIDSLFRPVGSVPDTKGGVVAGSARRGNDPGQPINIGNSKSQDGGVPDRIASRDPRGPAVVVSPETQRRADRTKDPVGQVGQALMNGDFRFKIRKLLEENFDARGYYLSGYSDIRVAEETGAPVEMVESIRKAAWGDLKEDPKVAALKAEIEGLRGRLLKLEKASGLQMQQADDAASRLRNDLSQALRDLRADLDRLATKVGR